jgi:hypothetical protein
MFGFRAFDVYNIGGGNTARVIAFVRVWRQARRFGIGWWDAISIALRAARS